MIPYPYLTGDIVIVTRGIKKGMTAVVQKVSSFPDPDLKLKQIARRFDVLVEDGTFCQYSPQSLSRWVGPTEQDMAIARDGLMSLLSWLIFVKP